mgnify:CR=1 FL=1
MKENHEIMSDEELKQFFLNEAMLLCPSESGDVSEYEKLQNLYNTQKNIIRLLRVLNHCNMEMHYVEVYHVYGYYFMEKEGEKRKKRKMSERLEHYGQFMYQLTKMKCIIGHYYAYSLQHLRSIERIIELYFPGTLQNKMKAIPGEQKVTMEEEEQEK